jgi:hypothetical protein
MNVTDQERWYLAWQQFAENKQLQGRRTTAGYRERARQRRPRKVFSLLSLIRPRNSDPKARSISLCRVTSKRGSGARDNWPVGASLARQMTP